MGYGHAALCACVVLALYAVMVSSRPPIKFETGKSLSRTYGPLKLQSSQHHSSTRITKLPIPPITVTSPPIVSPNGSNGTSNTTKIEVCLDCVCYTYNYYFLLFSFVLRVWL